MDFLDPIPNLNDEFNRENISKLNHYINNGNPTFLFLYMDGCGPCDSTKKEWERMKQLFPKEEEQRSIVVAQVNKDLYGNLKGVGSDPMAFPTLRYIKGDNIEEYESGRTAEALAGWINGKTNARKIDIGKGINQGIFPKRKTVKIHKLESEPTQHSAPKTRRRGKHRKRRNKTEDNKKSRRKKRRRRDGKSITGGKWSRKYKRSIDCNKPRGFSQRQHCKYGRKKK